MNRYPMWRYVLIVVVLAIGTIYVLPNLYRQAPALQISPLRGAEISDLLRYDVEQALETAGISALSMEFDEQSFTLLFGDNDTRLRAREVLSEALGRSFVVALKLQTTAPGWLRRMGMQPMFLGLDLRGGVHFLMEVDMAAAVRKLEERYISDLRSTMREKNIRYRTVTRPDGGGILLRFQDAEELRKGQALLASDFPDLDIGSQQEDGEMQLVAAIREQTILEAEEFALKQNITTLRKRVNELGVAEPIVQQQGRERIVVQLPGVEDTARAKEILGATATLEFRMVDEERDAQEVADSGRVPPGRLLHYDRNGWPVLLKKRVMLTGDHIMDASSGFDPQTNEPDVSIVLDGKGAQMFLRATRDEVGNKMAVLFIENQVETVEEDGELIKRRKQLNEVISVATILEQLGKRFHITGLDSPQEARNLALLLRAGALAVPIEIVEERTVGPSLGKENIARGLKSVIFGFILVLIFMVLYYRSFGMVANIALALNLVFIVAMLSMLQATLTLPGIAGIVLTVGMAVDANVLIFERIREELQNGNSPQASIHAGYERAFSTIADANITTLIAAIVLFSFGTGPIKGFAVTLSLGILSSMFTSITVSRAIINLLYGQKRLKQLPV